jgi:hypothetical protein
MKASARQSAFSCSGSWLSTRGCVGPLTYAVGSFTPLTPALSPLRGEGVAARLREPSQGPRDGRALGFTLSRSLARPDTRGTPKTPETSPSPLNGERAGVRGVKADDPHERRGLDRSLALLQTCRPAARPLLNPALRPKQTSDFGLRASFGFRLSAFRFVFDRR